ncbi:MAG: ferrochelatase [Deltaproteobacteria bacterium]|mgnify:CR=1 FL=1
MSKKGVLLLAFGGADSIEDVEPFVKNVLKGRPVTPEVVEKAKERYRLIGGSSPLLKITQAQAVSIKTILADPSSGWVPRGMTLDFFIGMRFWHPYIKDVVKEMKDAGITEAVAIIMAPHSSRASTGGYVSDIEAALKETGGVPKVEFVEGWHTHPLYIDALLEKIEEALKGAGDGILTIFTAHSLPVPSLAGDPYLEKLNSTIACVVKKKPLEWKLAFQSKGGGAVPWLGPTAEEVIKEAKEAGKKGVLIVPLGFVADHVETLYDIDILFKKTAIEAGLRFSRAASLNDSPKFISMLADVIKRHGGAA